MSQLLRALGLGVLVLALVVGVGSSGDAKKGTGKKVGIPIGWKALSLSKEQRDKVIGIARDYRSKIAVLQRQIDDLKAQERADQVKVLTDAQKAILLKGLTGESKEKTPAKDKDKVKK